MTATKLLACLIVAAATALLVSAAPPTGPVAAATAPADVAAGTYAVDTVHSGVLFRVMHNNVAPFWGRFDRFSGELVVDPAEPGNYSVRLTIDAESVSTGNEKRDQHLRHTDFFSVKEFPEVSFASESVVPEGSSDYLVKGQLTLLGRTRPVTMTITRTGAGPGPRDSQLLGFEGSFTILRSDFGMDYGQGSLGDEVRVTLAIEAVRR